MKNDLDLRLSPESCPSQFKLDRFDLGELDSAASEALNKHLSECGDCSVVLQERKRTQMAFSKLDRAALLANIDRGLTAERLPVDAGDAGSWLDRLGAWLRPPARVGGLAAAAMAATLFVLWQKPTVQEDYGVRTKGGSLGLTVYRERQGEVAELFPQDRVRAGDRLRFRVKVPPKNGAIMIVGVEASGNRFSYYPLTQEGSRAISGLDGASALDAAVVLDDSTGREGIHLVWCPQAFQLDAIGGSDGPRTLQVPVNCRTVGFEVLKE